jgi:hypothetical protein
MCVSSSSSHRIKYVELSNQPWNMQGTAFYAKNKRDDPYFTDVNAQHISLYILVSMCCPVITLIHLC